MSNDEDTITQIYIEPKETLKTVTSKVQPKWTENKCAYCNKKYKAYGTLRKHQENCSRKPPSEVVFCTNNTGELEVKPEQELIQETQNQQDKQRSSCRVCGKTFKYAKILEKHEAMHGAKFPFWCKLCMQNFQTYEEKISHKINEHPNKGKKRKCRLCPNLNFETEEEFLFHVNEVHKGKFDDYFMCSDCGKQFKTKSELTHHNNSKCGTVKQYKCKVCNQDLMTAGSLHNHMLRHTGERCCMCGYCGKMFLTVGQLKVHERTHTQEKAFVCNVCGKGFCHRQSLITHSTLHTGVKPYQCENCGSSFSCVGNLIKHRRTHADTCGSTPLTTHRVNNPSTKMKVKINTPKTSKLKTIKKEMELQAKLAAYKEKLDLSSNDCEFKEDKDNSELIKLLNDNEDHGGLQEPYNQAPDDDLFNSGSEPTIKDFIPDDKTVKEEVVEDYLCHNDENSEINEDCYKSDECYDLENDDDHSTIENEVKHKPRKAKISKKEVKEFIRQRGFENRTEAACQYCSKLYTNFRWLLRHEREHVTKTESSTKYPYKCSCCKAGFETKDECKMHQKNSHAQILTCQECYKFFSNVDSLRSHQNVFHKGLPRKIYVYVCEKCGLQFKQKAFLNHHERNNCGSGPIYECHICGKGFNSVHTRRSHLRIHDPKKKFLCKFCGKSFRWKGQLKIHERSHTGEKPFKCLYCPKAFAYRESLVTHSSLHTGVKPHLCQACGSRFSCIGNLIKHRSTHANTCGVWYTKNQQ